MGDTFSLRFRPALRYDLFITVDSLHRSCKNQIRRRTRTYLSNTGRTASFLSSGFFVRPGAHGPGTVFFLWVSGGAINCAPALRKRARASLKFLDHGWWLK